MILKKKKPITPKYTEGNPNTSDCHEFITVPQSMTSFTEQIGV